MKKCNFNLVKLFTFLLFRKIFMSKLINYFLKKYSNISIKYLLVLKFLILLNLF